MTGIEETYRKTDLRLRLLLLGDGIDSPGVVRGEEQRRQVAAEIRHLRDAFDALIEQDSVHESGAAANVGGGLDEDLQMIASLRPRSGTGPRNESDLLLRPRRLCFLELAQARCIERSSGGTFAPNQYGMDAAASSVSRRQSLGGSHRSSRASPAWRRDHRASRIAKDCTKPSTTPPLASVPRSAGSSRGTVALG